MTLRERIARQPQTFWIRRAIFQVHLWAGIGVGAYILAVSVSGSAVVFRHELAKALLPTKLVASSGRRLTRDELAAAAKRAYPRFDVSKVWISKNPQAAVEIWMTRNGRRRERLFDPFTAKDLGDALPYEPWLVDWLVRFHDDLLGGRTGRLVNGAGATLLTALCFTGAIIWWPGTARMRRSLVLRWGGNWRRFNWDLHSTIGFWMFLFVLMWGVSGIYLAYPEPFSTTVDWLQPPDPDSFTPRFGDEALAWLARIHFGRAWGTSVKALWVILGLVPAALFVSGAVMWWNRVLSVAIARSRSRPEASSPHPSPSPPAATSV
jgi:uncharacterized iron-regulated membrane protein